MAADWEGGQACPIQKKHQIFRDRAFLQNNKIFFETIAASLLSLMAIILSVAQIYITAQQTELVRIQAEISRQQALPQFVVRAEHVFDQDAGKVGQENIIAENRGGIAYDLAYSDAVFFDVSYLPKNPREGNLQKIEIAINGYYSLAVVSARGTGLLITLRGGPNWERRLQLDSEFQALADYRGAYGSIDIRRYLKLSYRDVFGSTHTEY